MQLTDMTTTQLDRLYRKAWERMTKRDRCVLAVTKPTWLATLGRIKAAWQAVHGSEHPPTENAPHTTP